MGGVSAKPSSAGSALRGGFWALDPGAKSKKAIIIPGMIRESLFNGMPLTWKTVQPHQHTISLSYEEDQAGTSSAVTS
jgi:hypothetical protein